MIWAIAGLFAVAVGLALAQSFLVPSKASAGVTEADFLEAAVELEEASLGAEDYHESTSPASISEAKRRLLAVNQTAEQMHAGPGYVEALRGAGIALSLIAPAAALALYWSLGSPELVGPSSSFAASAQRTAAGASSAPPALSSEALQAMDPSERAEMIQSMVDGLTARLADAPDDRDGWLMLGRSQAVLGNRIESARAYGEAVRLSPDDVETRILHARSLLAVPGDKGEAVTAGAQSALKALLTLKPDDPLALYYLGVAAEERGDFPAARTLWIRLLAQMPTEAPAAEQLRGLIEKLQPPAAAASPKKVSEGASAEPAPQQMPANSERAEPNALVDTQDAPAPSDQ
ncbi:MAG: hypothetical protein AAF850_06495 [Pseudomonadota bacterium]